VSGAGQPRVVGAAATENGSNSLTLGIPGVAARCSGQVGPAWKAAKSP
jgi:hypothetical protein